MLAVGAESQVDRFTVGSESIGAELQAVQVAGRLVAVGIAGVRIGPRHAAGQIDAEPTRHIGRTLAKGERGHKPRVLVDADPQVNVALVVGDLLLVNGQTGLLFSHVGPLLV